MTPFTMTVTGKRFNLPWSGQVENMNVEGLFVHGGDLWQLKHHHHAFSHHNKGRPLWIQLF
ncbi:hypothetical protein [Escherichia coli]|uniref:hypothetical protein n=1 Tax=Escherichia coli TaxID=562 RepID=UPI002023A513|nr:hypothetical protein [Escherichia coli]